MTRLTSLGAARDHRSHAQPVQRAGQRRLGFDSANGPSMLSEGQPARLERTLGLRVALQHWWCGSDEVCNVPATSRFLRSSIRTHPLGYQH
jgi:hypothetical protein